MHNMKTPEKGNSMKHQMLKIDYKIENNNPNNNAHKEIYIKDIQ